MPTIDLEKTRQAWTNLKPILFIPRSESEYEQLVIMLKIMNRKMFPNYKLKQAVHNQIYEW